MLLFVDEEKLASLVPHGTDPVQSLRDAIGDYVVVSPDNQFGPVQRILKAWRKTDQRVAPPILPVLAMCVLAATKMDNSLGQRSSNYYAPLAELLVGKPDEEVAEALRTQDCETLSYFWMVLNKWVEEQKGRVGFSTIRTVGNNRHIGYPLSQSILKETDKRLLFQFFDEIDLPVNRSVNVNRVMESLEKWVVNRQGFSRRLRLSLERSPDRQALEQLIIKLVSIRVGDENWRDAAISEPLKGTVTLALDEDWSEWFLLLNLNKPGNLSRFFWDSRELRIEDSDNAQMKYGYLNEPVNLSSLNRGFSVTNSVSTFNRQPFGALLMEKNHTLQAWVETKTIFPGKVYKVLANEREIKRLRGLLPDVLKFNKPTSLDDILGSFHVTRDIRIDTPFEANRLSSVLDLRTSISRVKISHAKLEGGLKLSSNKIQHLYFVGGEPDLYFQDLIPAKTYPVLINGEALDLEVRNGHSLQLRDLKLPEGKHRVETVNSIFHFQTSKKPFEMTEISSLGRDSLDAYLPQLAEEEYQRESPLLLRRNCKTSIFLLRGGSTHVVREPGKVTLAWDSSLTFYTTKFEVEDVPPKAHYVAQLYRGKWEVKDLRSVDETDHTVPGSLDLAHQWYLAHRKQRMRLWDFLLRSGEPINDE